MKDLAVFLLVDDDRDDLQLIRRAFLKAQILNPLYAVTSGEEAIAYLGGEGKYARRDEFPLPTLVLLDLRMPGIDGVQVLRWIRQQPLLRGLRVVVLTGSQDVRDIDAAYKVGANSFLIKPTDFERFIEVSRALAGHWVWSSAVPEIPAALPEIPASPLATSVPISVVSSAEPLPLLNASIPAQSVQP